MSDIAASTHAPAGLAKTLKDYKGKLEAGTRFIPDVRSIASAWVLTLPAAMAVVGLIYVISRHLM